ncbi:MAG: hypothetical protein ACOYVK_07030 [Bacillota bacterium]
MNNFMNRLFNGMNVRGLGKRGKRNTASKSAILNNMPENVLYGEDAGAIPPDEFTNQLEDEFK